MIDFKDVLRRDILNPESVTSVGDDFYILDNSEFLSSGKYPYTNDWLIATLCESGSANGTINLREYQLEKGGFIIILPGQVIVKSSMSEDFKGKVLLMSKRFSDTLEIGRTLTITTSIESRPYYQFKKEAIDITLAYVASCKAMIRQNEGNPAIKDILRLLTKAFFLGATPLLQKQGGTSPSGSYGRLTEAFLALVENNYRKQRRLNYYADALGRNVKYLSRHIKDETGQGATDWIERCVILDAEAQLLSSNKTILEISDSLGFPSQSFFGKYFKRVTGLSPKEFRAKR